MAGQWRYVALDGREVYSDVPYTPPEGSGAVMLTEPAQPEPEPEPDSTQPDATAELARLLGELRQLRAEVERNRLAVQQAAGSGRASAPEDPQQRVEALARRAMCEEGLDLGQAYRLVAREQPDTWAAARQAATLSEHPGGRQTWD